MFEEKKIFGSHTVENFSEIYHISENFILDWILEQLWAGN